jgi:hypothetical protein
VSSADLTFIGDLAQANIAKALESIPSGLLKFNDISTDPILPTINSEFPAIADLPHHMVIQKFTAKVKNWVFDVGGATVNGATQFDTNWNFLALGATDLPQLASGIRHDIVFLEVFRALVKPSVATNKPSSTKIYNGGNTQWGDSGTNIDDNLIDPSMSVEHSARVQVQYRIRLVPGVQKHSIANPDPMLSALVLARGAAASPVAGYTFTQDATDPGLYVAGSGDSTSRLQLGTVDGVVYAIPLLLVTRRNNQAFSASTNKNGSSVSIASGDPSDRPDGLYYDQITLNDIEALYHRVSLSGIDESAILEAEFEALLSGKNSTRTKTDTTGTVGGTKELLQIDGISPIPPGQSGIDDIGQPDNVRRVFSDGKVHQRTVGQVTEGSSTSGTTVEFYTTYPMTGNPDLPNGLSNIIQIRADQSLMPGAFIGIGHYTATVGDPELRWRTSKAQTILTNQGVSTTALTLDRLLLTKDSIDFEERVLDGGSSVGTIRVSDYFSKISTDGAIIIGSRDLFNTIDVVMTEEVNTVLGNLEADYMDATGTWCSMTINPGNDGTKNPTSTGASFAKSGQIFFTPPAAWSRAVFNGGPALYYIRIKKTVAPGFKSSTTIQKLTPQWKSNYWKGFNTDRIWAQVNTVDANYSAGDIIDCVFDILWPGAAGLNNVPDVKKVWRISTTRAPFAASVVGGSQRHDVAFIPTDETYKDIDMTVAPVSINATDYQPFTRDYNPLDPSYSTTGPMARHVVGYFAANGAASYTLPGSFTPASFGSELTAPLYVLNYYRFEVQNTPGVWTDLNLAAPPSLIRNNVGTFTVTFASAVTSGKPIRYYAEVDIDLLPLIQPQKGFADILTTEQILDNTTADGLETVFEFVFSGEIKAYETQYNSAGPNVPVAWVDSAPLEGSYTRENVSVSILNKRILQVTFGSAPISGSSIRISALVSRPLNNTARIANGVLSPATGSTINTITTENLQIAYTHKPYQGFENELPLPTQVKVLAVLDQAVATTLGTGVTASRTQADRRYAAVTTRVPLVFGTTDSQLAGDALTTATAFKPSMLKTVSLDNVSEGQLKEGSILTFIDDNLGSTNTVRGIQDHSIIINNDFGYNDTYIELASEKVTTATKTTDSWQIIHAALVQDLETREIYLLVITTANTWSTRTTTGSTTSGSTNTAFDLFKTRERWLA